MSFMNKMQAKYANKGLKIIAINLDANKADATTFLKKNLAKFTIAYDAEGITPSIYKLKVMPTSYLIDKKRNLIKIHKGFKESQEQQLENHIIKALKKV